MFAVFLEMVRALKPKRAPEGGFLPAIKAKNRPAENPY
jgi:hypothetical protein